MVSCMMEAVGDRGWSVLIVLKRDCALRRTFFVCPLEQGSGYTPAQQTRSPTENRRMPEGSPTVTPAGGHPDICAMSPQLFGGHTVYCTSLPCLRPYPQRHRAMSRRLE